MVVELVVFVCPATPSLQLTAASIIVFLVRKLGQFSLTMKLGEAWKNRELDEAQKVNAQGKDYKVFERYECQMWKQWTSNTDVRQPLHERFPYKTPPKCEVFQKIKRGNLLDFVECDHEVIEDLGQLFAKVPPFLETTNTGRDGFSLLICSDC